jgi:hypothetical protein
MSPHHEFESLEPLGNSEEFGDIDTDSSEESAQSLSLFPALYAQ